MPGQSMIVYRGLEPKPDKETPLTNALVSSIFAEMRKMKEIGLIEIRVDYETIKKPGKTPIVIPRYIATRK